MDMSWILIAIAVGGSAFFLYKHHTRPCPHYVGDLRILELMHRVPIEERTEKPGEEYLFHEIWYCQCICKVCGEAIKYKFAMTPDFRSKYYIPQDGGTWIPNLPMMIEAGIRNVENEA